MRGRLVLTVYVAALVLVFVAAAVLVAAVAHPHRVDLDAASRDVASELHDSRAGTVERDDEIDVAFYDADGHRLGSGADRARTAIGIVREHRTPAAIIKALVAFVAIVILLALAIALYIGSPLRRIANAVQRFGSGELSARTNLRRKDELGDVGRAFDEMATRVTSLMSAQRELMANVSHELQTPLARIQVAVDLMTDGIDDRVHEVLPEISRDLAELGRLIDDMMTLARLELAQVGEEGVAQPLRIEPSSIADVLEQATARFRSQHVDRELVLQIERDLPPIEIDRVLVRRVIENLLDNARKYSEPPAEIHLRSQLRDGRVQIAVDDHGIGIAVDDLRQLFTPFFRTDRSRARATGGVGLGLTLAKRVVEAHRGTISIASELDRGTTVTVELLVTGRAAQSS
jgi:signal transduction histidine kinase